ncbi:efflux RND transporter periplasmic adaptor subunit [Hydrogenimonas sp.]
MANKTYLKWIALFVLLLLAGYLFYQKVYIPKSTYASVTAKKGSIPLTIFGIGTVAAKNLYPVCASTGGRLLEVSTEEGRWVEKGEVVAMLDGIDLPQQLAQAEALLLKARLEKEASEKEIKGLEAKKRLAESTFLRYDRLHKRGFAAQAEYDQAKADLLGIESSIEASRTRIRSAAAEIERARHAVDALKERIARLAVTAPVTGYVITKNARAGETILPQQPVVTMVKKSDVWVKIYVDERISGPIRVGAPAKITLRSRADTSLPGTVVRIEPKSDPVTQERIVDVAFKKLPEPFYIDEQAEAVIETGRVEGAVTLPAKAVRSGFVWVYRDKKAHKVQIEVVGRSEGKVALKGIEAGTRVILPDPKKRPLFEGASVRL